MRNSFRAVLAAGLFPLAAGAVTIDMVTVGDIGNAPDPLNTNAVPGIGSVEYAYQIGKFEINNSEYVDFLNAVAATDTYGVYNAAMASDPHGGIVQDGGPGSYTYSLREGYANLPVTFVSFYDAARFANWLENGQPIGAQSGSTTETGMYTLSTSGTTTTGVSSRTRAWGWVIPTENEWYKAAYYDPTASGTANYWLYPMQTDTAPYSDQPPGTSSPDASIAGNFYQDDGLGNGFNDGYAKTGSPTGYAGTNYLTDVGAYTLADSYYGTFDQGGNLWEWNETIVGSYPGTRGGSFGSGPLYLQSPIRTIDYPIFNEIWDLGFRVAFVIPEPSSVIAMLLVGLGLCVRMRRRIRRR